MPSKKATSKKKRPKTRRTSVLQVNSTQKSSPVGLPAGAVLLFGGLCLLMLGWGVLLFMTWMGEVLFTENDRFTLEQIETRSDGGLLTPAIILGWGGATVGDNSYDLDLNEIRSRLEKHAIVRKAVVKRKLPDTLIVAVNERVPIGRMGQVEGGMNWLFDEEGIILKKDFEFKHLPMIRGANVNVGIGDDVSKGKAGPAIPYLIALRDMPGKIRDLLPVHVVNVGHTDFLDFRLKDGFQIKFPRDGDIDKLIMESSRILYKIHNENLDQMSLDMCPEGPNRIAAPE
ncbi:FtsQ-type POTRA domain-containing protein [Kiritimatiellaeota bacterium B1221]|nr:FtsQ-type POTRA domain-containing protein [Kiritimatiellaeota bacterium B1221]